MSRTATPMEDPDILLRLLLEDIRNRLIDKARKAVLEAVMPNIRATVEEALEAMKPRIQAYADHHMDRLVVQLSIKEVP